MTAAQFRSWATLGIGAMMVFGMYGTAWGSAPDTSAATVRQIVDSIHPFPTEARKPMDNLLAFAADPQSPMTPCTLKPLIDFVRDAAAKDSGWELPERNGAEGAAYVIKIKVPLAQYLALNFHPGIPDYAVFAASLRYSACLDSNAMQRTYACIGSGPTGTQDYVWGKVTGMEEITPNPESGCYFAYTNSRLFLRCKIEGRDVLFSCSETVAPSSCSQRGVPIGPLGQALFYYSEKPGLNLRGMTWMLSQINRSTTVSIYAALNSNETAVTTFAWLNAGWKGLNVTRTEHILNSQINTLEFSRRLAENPRLSPTTIASIVDAVNRLPPGAIDADYERYLTYIRDCRDHEQRGLFGKSSLLQDLYDVKACQSVPLTHRRALLIQERIRTLMGMPTWSSVGQVGAPLPP